MNSAVRGIFKSSIFIFASVCLAAFFVSPALAQHGSHGGGSHGGGSHGGGSAHAGGFSGGGSHSGGARVGGAASSSSASSSSVHNAPSPAPARMSVSSGAEGSRGSSFSSTPRTAISSPPATEAPAAERSAHTIFVSGPGRMTSVPLEAAPMGQRAFAAGNRLWEAPPSPANQSPQAQQQAQRPVATPPPVRPAPMPVAPAPMPVAPAPVGARPMQMPGPVILRPPMTPPVATPPVMTPPVAGVHVPFRAPLQNPTLGRGIPVGAMPGPAIRTRLPGAPRVRIGGASGAPAGAPLPVPPKFGHVALETGLGGTPGFTSSKGATGLTATAPAQFCIASLPNCGRGFGLDGDFDFDDGFGRPPLFIFAFGGPFGFGGPCLFDGFFLNCFSTGWNGPFGWGWGTPWGYDPSGTGLMYPVAGGYYSPTPVEQNQASVESPGPSAFLPPQPAPLTLAPSQSQAQPVAYLVTKDGIEFGVTKYWVEDNRICYITTYNIQSCISLDQLDLQATVDINYKRGITFTLTPKQDSQQPPQ